MPRHGRTASVIALRPVLACARSQGVDVAALLTRLGLVPESLEDPDQRIPESLIFDVWHDVVQSVGGGTFGLVVAEQAQLGAYDVLDYAIFFSSSVREALDRFIRFHRLLADGLAIEMEVGASEVQLRRVHRSTPREDQDLVFASLYLRLRGLTDIDLRPREVRFQHDAPEDATRYPDLFRCKVSFGRAVSCLILSAADLDRPTQSADPQLSKLLERHARDLLGRLPAASTFVGRARHVIAKALSGGPPSLAATAKALRASPRTVQRRLAAEGTSHRTLVDGVRRELAESYLRTPGLSIGEIAFLLGFTEESGFRRTYRRWTGSSPSRARAR